MRSFVRLPLLRALVCSAFASAAEPELCEAAADVASMAALEPLVGEGDNYEGVIVDADQLPTVASEFSSRLAHSLQAGCSNCCMPLPRMAALRRFDEESSAMQVWEASGRRGLWLKIPIHKADLVPLAVAAGFYFHHAERVISHPIHACQFSRLPSRYSCAASHRCVANPQFDAGLCDAGKMAAAHRGQAAAQCLASGLQVHKPGNWSPSAPTIGEPCSWDADVSTRWTRVSQERMLLRAIGRRRRLCAERAAGGARGPGAQRPAAGQGRLEDAHRAADPGRGCAGGGGA